MKKFLSASLCLLFSCAIASAKQQHDSLHKPETVSAYYILKQLLNEPDIKNKEFSAA